MRATPLRVQGENLPAIGQGAGGITRRSAQDPCRDDLRIGAIRLGLEAGMRFIDTAEVYADGHSERLVERAVRECRDQVFLASKVAPEHLRAGDLARACEGSLVRLGTDRLDLYQIHWPNPAVPLEESLGAMAELRAQGKIRHIGVCNFSLDEVRAVRRILGATPLFSVQTEYNLCERGPERDLLPYCAQEDLLLIAYSPLDQGRVAGSAPIRAALAEVAGAAGRAASQVALQFLASRGPVLPIPQASGAEHIRLNAEACDWTLAPAELAWLDERCRLPVEAIPWERIRPARDHSGEHQVYQSVAEALANPGGLTPAPAELALAIRLDDRIKPCRVTRLPEPDGAYLFDLVEGRLRFWAWVIAFEGARPVPVLVRS
jgi:aryl-alcohol dehydrogenase-like predicted oxidoreductase